MAQQAGGLQEYWFQGLTEGMDQATDPSLSKGSPLLKNVTLDQVGNWATRKGSTKLGNTVTSSDRSWGLFALNQLDGTRKLMMVTQRDLYALNEGTASWGSPVASDNWPADKRVDGVNFLNRLYLGSENGTTALAYTTGSSLTNVTPAIGGGILAVNKDMLAVAGNNIKKNVIFFTDPFTQTFHSATGTCAANADVAGANSITATSSIFEADMEGSILYNSTDGAMNLITNWVSATVVETDASTATWDNDTIYVLQNNFKIDGACTGMVAYGENFISWDEDNMYMWDPTVQPNGWSTKVTNAGCVNHRTAKVVDGSVIYVNREGVWLWGGQGKPIDITPKIRDKINGYGLWDLISTSNWSQLAAGVRASEGKYVLSVGDLSTVSGAPASAQANTVFVFDTKKGSWHTESYPDEPMVFETFIDTNGSKDLYYGGKASSGVFKLRTGTTDAVYGGTTEAIAFDFRTPHHVLGDPRRAHRIKEYFVKYTSTNSVTITVSVDRGSYQTLKTLPASATVKVQAITPLAAHEGFSHSLKFAGTGAFTLEGYGFAVEELTTTRSHKI